MLEAGYVDAFRMIEPDGRGYTFPTWDPHLRLDYAFMPARDVARLRRCRVLKSAAADTASDHLPLEMTLELGRVGADLALDSQRRSEFMKFRFAFIVTTCAALVQILPGVAWADTPGRMAAAVVTLNELSKAEDREIPADLLQEGRRASSSSRL